MDGHESDQIEELVAEALARIEEQGPSAAEALYREHPQFADALRLRLEWLLETGLAGSPPPSPTPDYPEQLGDFRLIEPIGKGGMGVVYRAEQLSLGREVALKLVRPENLYFPGARERFEREVTTVAALAHPGIVPVFSVGQEEGVPYFAMEHVRGASIGDILAHLAGRAPRELEGSDLLAALNTLDGDSAEEASSLFDGTWPTVCARIGREIAEALEHAHRRGVLHRDVKPTNVMLTRGGRVMLVDFGLSSHEAVRERRTQTGQAVGTLAYMAPEQLRGERELDARADVFALGVTLYEMLSLRLPHDASSSTKRLTRADAPLPADLRRSDARVSWELETVIQTACEPEPARRYASAADLARDLGNVLENRPIEARRASPWLRLRRWAQRQPAAALALLVVVVGPSVLAVQELRANRALSKKSNEVAASNLALGAALDDANRQRHVALAAQARAEQHFARAYEAIEVMLSEVGGEELEQVPRMEPIRQRLLREALRLQEELLEGPEEGRVQQGLYALTLQRAAALRAEIGELEASLDHLDEAARVLDQLLEAGPDHELERQRGTVDYRRAEVSRLLDRDDLAAEHAERAVERLDELRKSDAGSEALWAVAVARNELAAILAKQGKVQESREQLEESTFLLAELTEQGQATWAQRRAFAKTLHLMAGFPEHSLLGQTSSGRDREMRYDPQRGEPLLREALELRQQLISERPADYAVLANLAATAQQLGSTLTVTLRFDEAEVAHRTALDAYEQLVDAFPARPAYADGLASQRYNLSLLAGMLGRPDERIALLKQAVEGYETLVDANPGLGYQHPLALALGQLGQALREEDRDLDAAEVMLWRSLELGTPLYHENGDPDLRTSLAWSNGVLASIKRQRGDAEATVDLARNYLDLDPRPVEVAWAANFIATAVARGRRGGVSAQTLDEWTDEALGLLEGLIDRAPDDPEVLHELTEPEFAVFDGQERFEALLEAFGVQR